MEFTMTLTEMLERLNAQTWYTPRSAAEAEGCAYLWEQNKAERRAVNGQAFPEYRRLA